MRLTSSETTVPKKTKTTAKETETATAGVTEGNGAAANPARRVPGKARKASTGAKKATKRSVSKKTPADLGPQPTDEEIRIRAYFIAERRHRLALPGDADSDWLEAKRQLLSENTLR